MRSIIRKTIKELLVEDVYIPDPESEKETSDSELDTSVHAGAKEKPVTKKRKVKKQEQNQEDEKEILEKITEELQKTYAWFERAVFPALELEEDLDENPIIADDNYLSRAGRDPSTGNIVFPQFEENRPYPLLGSIKKGAVIKNDLMVFDPDDVNRTKTRNPESLETIYKYLEKSTLYLDLPIGMQSRNTSF